MINNYILIIDDDQDVLNLIKSKVKKSKYNVYTAEDCESARNILIHNYSQIKAIVLDWQMEKMSGIDFLREIKTGDTLKNIPVIMQTGYNDQSKMIDSLKAGVYYFLQKPVNTDALFSILDSAIKNYNNLIELGHKKNKNKINLEKIKNYDFNELIPEKHVRILLIDDEPDQAIFVKRYLKDEVFEFIYTSEINLLPKTIKEIQPDCILLDYNLGEKTAIDVINEIKDVHSEYPFGLIILTGQSTLDMAVETLKAGAQDFILKDNLNTRNLTNSIFRAIKNKNLESRLQYFVYHDELTKLTNRKFLMEYLNTILETSKALNKKFAVVYMDVDKFKNINDAYGHKTGDELLIAVATRIKKAIRDKDIVARLGGDEFVILLTHINNNKKANQVCQKILTEISKPFLINNQSISVTISIGFSIYPNDGENVDELIQNSDVAMYQSKNSGRATISEYNKELHLHLKKHIKMEIELKRALKEKEFFLLYQPKVDFNLRIMGVEALLRWKNPDKGVISPVDFIPILEKSGLIIPTGYWAIKEACTTAYRWQKSGLKKIFMAVNLSPYQFKDSNLLKNISDILEESKLDPKWLEIEITESGTMDNVTESIKILQQIKKMGIKISMDDFGTGFSSLSHLIKFPMDVLKIDKSFIDNITSDKNAITTTKTIINLGKNLSMKTIAEGVEDKDQFDILRQSGCHEIQGYYFSKPLPENELIKLLQKEKNLSKVSLN